MPNGPSDVGSMTPNLPHQAHGGVHHHPAPTGRLMAVLGLTAAFMVVEAVGGWISGSLALLADAGHMLADVGALSLALLTARIGLRPADDRNTYGYRRWEILGALVNGAALFAIAGWVLVEAFQRFSNPPLVRSGLMLAVASGGLLVNAIALAVLHGAHHHNLNTRGAYLHVAADLLGSLAAIAAALIIRTTGWLLADPILSVVVALLILGGAWRLTRESTDVLLEAVPRNVSLADVERGMLGVPGVKAVHDLHVWSVTSGLVAMSGHATVPDLSRHPDALEQIKATLASQGIGHVTVQLETGEEDCEGC